jgi:hypothetical protein
MGAAEAVLAAAEVEEVDAVYTFGAPRFANREFGEGLRMPVYRLVHNRDPITYLPPNTGGLRYAHTGTLIEYSCARVPPGILNNHSPVYYAVAAWNDAVSRIGGGAGSHWSR